MKIIISKDFLINLFRANAVDKKKYEIFIINLLKKNYRFYISAITCLEISRLLTLEEKRFFHSRIEILCEEILPLTFEIQKQISELEVFETRYCTEIATATICGIDLILKGDFGLDHSMSNLKVAEIGLEG